MKSKKKFTFPHIFVLLLSIILFVGILTYIIPAGNYDRETLEDGREVVDPDSYTQIEQTPIDLMDYLSAVPLGLEDAAEIVFFILIIGGSFNVLQETGALTSALRNLAKSGKDSPWIIPLIMTIFSLGGAVIGTAEESLLFIPIMISLALAMGYDSLTGLAIVLVGGMSGFAASIINPFNLGVAQAIAGIPLFSGMALRIALYVATILVSIIFVTRYAKKVKFNPEASPVYDIDQNRELEFDFESTSSRMELKEKFILLAVGIILVFLIIGVLRYDWYLTEISAVFIGMSMIVAIIGKMGFNKYADALGRGATNIAEGALIVGFARGILIVLEEGNILDTILHYATTGLEGLPGVMGAELMYGLFAAISFIIPSGTGQAAISIPIMTPIADMIDVTRQTMVFSFQFADGVSEILTPTSGWFMAGLALAKIPYTKWVKWVIPLLIMWYVIGAIFTMIAHMISYGPF